MNGTQYVDKYELTSSTELGRKNIFNQFLTGLSEWMIRRLIKVIEKKSDVVKY